MERVSDHLKHIVVLMMRSRSFDHMLGGLKLADPRIEGLTGNESNPENTDQAVYVQPQALFQGQFVPSPSEQFSAVDKQLFGGEQGNKRIANMKG